MSGAPAQRVAKPAASGARVVVAGGGAAGLETARLAAQAGHDVVLFEREAQLGGQLRVAAAAPTREELLDFVFYSERELGRLGVDVRTGVEATSAAILAEGPDLFVCATGATPLAPRGPGYRRRPRRQRLGAARRRRHGPLRACGRDRRRLRLLARRRRRRVARRARRAGGARDPRARRRADDPARERRVTRCAGCGPAASASTRSSPAARSMDARSRSPTRSPASDSSRSRPISSSSATELRAERRTRARARRGGRGDRGDRRLRLAATADPRRARREQVGPAVQCGRAVERGDGRRLTPARRRHLNLK